MTRPGWLVHAEHEARDYAERRGEGDPHDDYSPGDGDPSGTGGDPGWLGEALAESRRRHIARLWAEHERRRVG